ncbi:MAG TPA: PQQ-binding-like beta-propeller repeat protein [Anaerolineales bacterium]|nr:PQQ-binding-like beta-propeller repeat protein [Anaerolineales bacterium]
MTFKLHHFPFLAAVAAFALAACGAAPAQSWAGVTVSTEASTAYIADGTHLYALNTNDGTVRWQLPPQSSGGFLGGLFGGGTDSGVNLGSVFADPVLVDDTLIVTSFNKSVFALDAVNGTLQWTFSESKDRLIAPAAVYGDTIYVASADNSLYALDMSGQRKWAFTTQNGLWGAALPTEDVVYMPSMDKNLYAVDAATGIELWHVELDGAIAGTPALSVDGKTIFVGTLSDTLYALSTEDGAERWTVEATGWVWGTPLVTEATIYFGDLQGSVFAVDVVEGNTVWNKELGGSIRAKFALSDDTLIVPSDDIATGIVYALNAVDGSILWQKVIDDRNADRLLANPVIVGEVVLIVPITADKLVYALDVATGDVRWTFDQ